MTAEICRLLQTVRSATLPTQPPIEWVQGYLSSGLGDQGFKLTTHLHLVPKLGMYLHCTICLHNVTRDNIYLAGWGLLAIFFCEYGSEQLFGSIRNKGFLEWLSSDFFVWNRLSGRQSLLLTLKRAPDHRFFRSFAKEKLQKCVCWFFMYEGWNFNIGNYLFTTDTK